MGWSSAKGWNSQGWSGAVSAPASFTTLDPANKAATITLAPGNLSVSAGNNGDGVRSIASIGTGKKYKFEFQVGAGYCVVGICDAAYAFNGNIGSVGNNGIGLAQDGTIYAPSGNTTPGLANPGLFAVEIDTTSTPVIYFVDTANVRWGPYTIPCSTPFYAGLSCHDTSNSVTLNFGASAWGRTTTSGFVGIPA